MMIVILFRLTFLTFFLILLRRHLLIRSLLGLFVLRIPSCLGCIHHGWTCKLTLLFRSQHLERGTSFFYLITTVCVLCVIPMRWV